MERTAIHLFWIVLLLSAANGTRADVCGIVNGSFEDDGYVSDIAAKKPTGWSVEMPAKQFYGYIYRDRPTDGAYNLTLYTQRSSFEAGSMGLVSQQVNLADTEQIIFDLQVASEWSGWDPSVVSAVVLIDANVVWTSDVATPDDKGRYLGQVCPVAPEYRTPGEHKISFGLRANKTGTIWERYYTYWDAIRCTATADFNADSRVDVNDVMAMAAMWLHKVPAASPYNLCGIDDNDVELTGRVNFYDLAVLAGNWRSNQLEQE